jgi:GNAT superfamily N-acetyltransferase
VVSVSIRPFFRDDIPAALELCRVAGWNQMDADWARFIEYEPDGCFVAEIDGQLVGTVTTTCYGTDLAWIGMMLVHEDFRRRGIASDLINKSLDYLRGRQVRCIKLDATPTGLEVYRRLGFQSEWTFHRWMRKASSDNRPSIGAGRSVSLSADHLALDRTAFGAERSRWLEQLAEDSIVCLRWEGFGMLRSGFLADYLGPIVAANRDVASEIVRELLDQSSTTIFWDVPHPNQAGAEIAESLGFQPVRDLTRMWTGAELLDPAVELQYALSDPGTG